MHQNIKSISIPRLCDYKATHFIVLNHSVLLERQARAILGFSTLAELCGVEMHSVRNKLENNKQI